MGNAPSSRRDHHSTLIDGRLYLFGGHDGKNTLSAKDIYVLNVRERKWAKKLARGGEALRFKGGRCVAVKGIIYSYDENGVIHRLNPKNEPMTWKEMTTPSESRTPFPREGACLWAIGSRIIMFGGITSREIPDRLLQSGAKQTGKINNELYEFGLEKNALNGFWLDLEYGPRPEPRFGAAIATIDQSQGIMHAGYGGYEKLLDDAFLINISKKTWVLITFDPKPQHRCCHTLSPITIKAPDGNKICLLLLGGSKWDSVWILDSEESKAYQMNLGAEVAVFGHSAYCLENDDGTATVLLCGGSDSPKEGSLQQMLNVLQLDEKSGYVHKRESIEKGISTNIEPEDESPEKKHRKACHKRSMTAELNELKKTVAEVQSQLAETEKERRKLRADVIAKSKQIEALKRASVGPSSQDWQKKFEAEHSQHQATKQRLEKNIAELSATLTTQKRKINNFEVQLRGRDAEIERLKSLAKSMQKSSRSAALATSRSPAKVSTDMRRRSLETRNDRATSN